MPCLLRNWYKCTAKRHGGGTLTLLDTLVWFGILTFAAMGALTAVHKRFDLVGVVALAGVTAVGGGSIRDIVVGRLPPDAFRNEWQLWAVFAVALAVFAGRRYMGRLDRPIYYFDTLGLAFFAALGAERGVAYDLGFWGTVFAGTVSGVGGGVLRDLLSGEVPAIFHRHDDFYASAAALGAATVYATHHVLPAYAGLAVLFGAIAAAALRIASRWLRLSLPRA